MKRNKTLEKLGFGYIANHNPASLEIHKVENVDKHCNIEYIRKGGYCTPLWAWILIRFLKYNGCFWCNRGWHKK
jgi:hypothetical protein